MKNITLEVPRMGTSVELVLRTGASSGQAVIVASDDVEIRLVGPAPAAAAHPKSPPSTTHDKAPSPKAPSHDLDAIFQRLLKLKPNKRVAATNSIKAMFQFDAPLSDEAANTILEHLRRRGDLAIDAKDTIQFLNA